MTTLSGLPAADALTGTEIVPVVQDGATRRTTASALAGPASTNLLVGSLRVFSADCPADVKAQVAGDPYAYLCSGTNDQVEINAALAKASRPNSGFGGAGFSRVQLVGPNFYVGNNGIGIKMHPGTWLQGAGFGQFIQPVFSSGSPGVAVGLVNSATDHVILSDVHIGKINETTAYCDGVFFQQSSTATSYELATGNDPFIFVHRVIVSKPSGRGIAFDQARASQITSCLVWNAQGHCYDVSGSDSHLTDCNAQGGSSGHGFRVAGGNSKLTSCKAYYCEAGYDGFSVTSSRAELVGCAAQDNGRYGFDISSTDCTITGAAADSNMRGGAGGAGFRIAASGVYTGLHAFDRAQSPSRQTRGIEFSGSPTVMMSGRVTVPSGSDHVNGTPGGSSYARVLRDGSPIFTVGA